MGCASKTLVAMTLLASPLAAQNLDVQATIAALGQPEQTSIDFTEIRFSALLTEPLVVSGVLSYVGPQALDRQVLAPYRETTQIRSDTVSVSREGEAERSFALRRVPELQDLLHAFSALLAGDYAAIERDFTILGTGTAQLWQLELAPRAARSREPMLRLVIDGRADRPQCFWMLRDDASFSVMLLGALAASELPSPPTQQWLQSRCAS